MSKGPRETWQPRSAFARNKIRERDDLTASIIASRGLVEDYAVAGSSLAFGATGINFIPKRWSSFEDLDNYASPTDDFFVESGAVTALVISSTMVVDGKSSLWIRCAHNNGVVITTGPSVASGGAANPAPIPQPYPGTGAGKYYIFSIWRMRGATACTVKIELSNAAGDVQEVMAATALTTTLTKYTSAPFTITIDISAGFGIRYTMTSAAGVKNAYFDCAALNYVGTDDSITEPGPYAPGAESYWADYIGGAVTALQSGTVSTLAGTAVLDTTYVDSLGRPDTLRLTSGDLAAAGILYDSSGLKKDGAAATIAAASITGRDYIAWVASDFNTTPAGDAVVPEGSNQTTTDSKPFIGHVYIPANAAKVYVYILALQDATYATKCHTDVGSDASAEQTTSAAAGTYQTLTFEHDVSAFSAGLYQFAIYLRTSNVAFLAKVKAPVIRILLD